VQLTESAGVDVDDEFSWCCDFNRGVCSGDGSCSKSHLFFLLFSFFFYHILILFLAEAEGRSNKYKNSL